MEQWKQLVVLEPVRPYILIVFIYCYLGRDNDNVLKFHITDFSDFEISVCLC